MRSTIFSGIVYLRPTYQPKLQWELLLWQRFSLPITLKFTPLLCPRHTFPINTSYQGFVVRFHSSSFLNTSFVYKRDCSNVLVKFHFPFRLREMLCLQTEIVATLFLNFTPILFRRYAFSVRANCGDFII